MKTPFDTLLCVCLLACVVGVFSTIELDADAVFPKNPFNYYKQDPSLDLELCSDAPYLANNYENEPMMVMAGYFYARGGPRTARFIEEVLLYQAKHDLES